MVTGNRNTIEPTDRSVVGCRRNWAEGARLTSDDLTKKARECRPCVVGYRDGPLIVRPSPVAFGQMGRPATSHPRSLNLCDLCCIEILNAWQGVESDSMFQGA